MKGGVVVRCFVHDEEDREAIIEDFSQFLASGGYERACILTNEIAVVEEVMNHLESYGDDHMEYLVMFHTDGRILARGKKFIASVMQYSTVLEQRKAS